MSATLDNTKNIEKHRIVLDFTKETWYNACTMGDRAMIDPSPIHVDIPPVNDETEATVLMVYHLALAAAYFEATHDDRGAYANKLISQLPEASRDAASAFVDVLCSFYEALEDDE